MWVIRIPDFPVSETKSLIGPFPTSFEAVQWAEEHGGDPDSWEVIVVTTKSAFCPDCVDILTSYV